MFDAMTYINSFSHSGKPIKDLSRFSGLMEKLGNPQDNLKYVHIAGTNGKGSTLEYASNILIEAGYKVGQFTSPFILCYNDRIRINGENISDEDVAILCEQVKEVAVGDEYSQFEITLAIAFLYYVREKCDIIFLETGVGGLLDATNIIKENLCSVITSISYDHVNILGDTLEKIVFQKAGIIKKNSYTVLAKGNEPCVREVVENKCKEQNSKLIIPSDYKITREDIYTTHFIYENENYVVSMPGEHQVINAVSAIEIINILKNCGFDIQRKHIIDGMVNTCVGARTEFVNEHLIIDGGHNVAGVQSLVNTLKLLKGEYRLIGICGMVDTKDYSNSAKLFSDIFDEIVCTDNFTFNSVPAEKLAESFECETRIMNLDEVMNLISKEEKNTVYVVCGSLYLASEIKIRRMK